MNVSKLPTPARHPGHPLEFEESWHDQLPASLRRLLGDKPHANDPDSLWLAIHYLPDLCRLGIPESTLEAALGWRRGCLSDWRRLPVDPAWSVCARTLGDRCAAGSAEAEAELAATMQRRAATDPKAAQWLLERRSPARWSPASDDALGQARAQGAEAERARLIAAGWEPPDTETGLRLPLRTGQD